MWELLHNFVDLQLLPKGRGCAWRGSPRGHAPMVNRQMRAMRFLCFALRGFQEVLVPRGGSGGFGA